MREIASPCAYSRARCTSRGLATTRVCREQNLRSLAWLVVVVRAPADNDLAAQVGRATVTIDY